MRNHKKLTSLLLALVMVFSLSASAFAATAEATIPSNQVHVIFTKDCTYSYNTEEAPDVYENLWAVGPEIPDDYILYDAGNVTITDALLANKIAYLKGEHPDPLPGKVSYLDVIVEAAKNTTPAADYGWDSDPKQGEPGGYLYNFENQDLDYSWGYNSDGTMWMKGHGFVVCMGDAAEDDITFPPEYLSNIRAVGGITLYVDCGYYEYDWLTF